VSHHENIQLYGTRDESDEFLEICPTSLSVSSLHKK